MRASLSLGCNVNTEVYAVRRWASDAQNDRLYPRGRDSIIVPSPKDRQDLQSLAVGRGP